MTVPPPLPPPPAGTTPNLRHAWGGIWRLTWRRMLAPGRALVALALLVAFGLLSAVATETGNTPGFVDWAISFYLEALLPVAAFLSGAGAMRDDVKSTTVDYVLTRPVPRPVFVVFRFVAQLVCAQAIGLLAFAALMATAMFRQLPDLTGLAGPFLLAQALGITAFLALGFLCGALTSRYLVLGLLYGAIVEVGLGRIPIQLNRLSILHHLRTLLQDVAPGVVTAHGHAPSWVTLGVLGLISVTLLTLAAVRFAWQELAGDQPKDA